MPRWLAGMVPAFLDAAADAKGWETRLHAELERLGEVPFGIVHDWHANVVAVLALETSERRGGVPDLHRRVQALHLRAMAGERVPMQEWAAALRPALHEVYRHAFAYARSHARAHASAMAYAGAGTNAKMIAESFGSAQAYARTYADLTTGASVKAYADANARVNAEAHAAAHAAADADAYGQAHPYAAARAYVHAHAYGYAEDDFEAACREAYGRLADGMLDCLARTQ